MSVPPDHTELTVQYLVDAFYRMNRFSPSRFGLIRTTQLLMIRKDTELDERVKREDVVHMRQIAPYTEMTVPTSTIAGRMYVVGTNLG